MKKPITLRDLRMKVGLTQDALAEASRTTLRHIQRIEAGDSLPTVKLAIAIAQALSATVEDIDWIEKQADG
jgi:DNA-binding XRE family transcriptional regulator